MQNLAPSGHPGPTGQQKLETEAARVEAIRHPVASVEEAGTRLPVDGDGSGRRIRGSSGGDSTGFADHERDTDRRLTEGVPNRRDDDPRRPDGADGEARHAFPMTVRQRHIRP